MSNFLEKLDSLSNARNDTTQLYEDLNEFADRYFDEVAGNLLEALKNIIMLHAQKGEFSYENGKRVIKGEHKIDFGVIHDKCSPKTVSERRDIARKFTDMKLPVPELISFTGYPKFETIGEVTSASEKKGFFSKLMSKQMTKVRFSLPKGLAIIFERFKEKALEEGIVLSNLTYTYMSNTLNKETQKTEGAWITGCTLIFPDCLSPITYEWPSYSSKYEHTVSFGSSITGRLTISYKVSY